MVAVISPAAGPLGHVAFYDGGTLSGTAAVHVVNGQSVAYLTGTLAPGTHRLTAVYLGDLAFLGPHLGAGDGADPRPRAAPTGETGQFCGPIVREPCQGSTD